MGCGGIREESHQCVHVPVQERPSWRAYATQEPFHIAEWDADERVPARLKHGIAAQGLQIGPLVFVPLTTPHRRLGALGMSGHPAAAYTSEDIGFLRLIGRVVAFAIDDNFNLSRLRPPNENYNARMSSCNAAKGSFRKSLKRFR